MRTAPLPPQAPAGVPLVACHGLAAGYGGPAVLRDVSFAARAGERIAVLGPNGGGKSTLFRVLLGELGALRGRVEAPGRCAIVPQTDRSRLDFPVDALDVATMGALSRLPWWRPPGRAERRRALAALEVVGLADRARESFGALSGGQRQRVLIARALMQDARVMLLDEPFSGLDAASGDRLLALLERLAAEGRAVLVATHDLEQARAWELVLCLNGRQMAFGRPGEVLTRPVIEATYGAAVVPLGGDGAEMGVLPPAHHAHDHVG